MLLDRARTVPATGPDFAVASGADAAGRRMRMRPELAEVLLVRRCMLPHGSESEPASEGRGQLHSRTVTELRSVAPLARVSVVLRRPSTPYSARRVKMAAPSEALQSCSTARRPRCWRATAGGSACGRSGQRRPLYPRTKRTREPSHPSGDAYPNTQVETWRHYPKSPSGGVCSGKNQPSAGGPWGVRHLQNTTGPPPRWDQSSTLHLPGAGGGRAWSKWTVT